MLTLSSTKIVKHKPPEIHFYCTEDYSHTKHSPFDLFSSYLLMMLHVNDLI